MAEIGNHNSTNVPPNTPSIEDYSSMPLEDFTESLNQSNLDWQSLNQLAKELAVKEPNKAVLIYRKVQEITALQIANKLGTEVVGIDTSFIGKIGDNGPIVRYKHEDIKQAEIKINENRFKELTLQESMAGLMRLNKVRQTNPNHPLIPKVEVILTKRINRLLTNPSTQETNQPNNLLMGAYSKVQNDKMYELTAEEALALFNQIPVKDHDSPMAKKLTTIINKKK